MTEPLHTLAIAELGSLLEWRRVTAMDVLEACLSQISARDAMLNAFITVMEIEARAAAKRADGEIRSGRYRGPLHGVPVSLKDLIDVRGVPTTAASRVRTGLIARADAPVVTRLREAGAILIGKCNLHEFALGATGEDSAFGPTRHPYDPDRAPGGSSSGSAVSVAAGMCFGSVGTDTGGSIRIPAAACGIVGLKPTYGEIPLEGIVPLSRSLDHVGPLARSVQDAWLLYRCLAGDRRPLPLLPAELPRLNQVTLGLPREYFLDQLDDEVRACFEDALARLRQAGCRVEEVTIPDAAYSPALYMHVQLAEAAAYHARTMEQRPADYTTPVRLRLELGRYVLAEDYLRAQRGRIVVRAQIDEALRGHHALALPTLAIPAPRLGAATVQVGSTTVPTRNAALRLTQPFNLTGHPAISLPCGRTRAGLPCGLQLVGPRGKTVDLVKLASACEPRVSR